jgi:adenylosuccinate synthase
VRKIGSVWTTPAHGTYFWFANAIRGLCVRYIIAISGPVAVGKSALADELLQRFNDHRISTRQLLIDTGCQNERDALIEAGKRLDTETGGRWVRDGIARYVAEHEGKDVILVDAVRTAPQIAFLRETYGERLVHVHVTAPFEVIKKQYEDHGSLADTGMTYDQVRADPTGGGVWLLDGKADRVVVNHNKKPASLLALAVSVLGLFQFWALAARISYLQTKRPPTEAASSVRCPCMTLGRALCGFGSPLSRPSR